MKTLAITAIIAATIFAAVLAPPSGPTRAAAASAVPKGKGGAGGAGDIDDITRRVERELDRITSGLERDQSARDRRLKVTPTAAPPNRTTPSQRPQ